MSYVLYFFEKSFNLIDRTDYKGAPLFGSEIDVKKDGKVIKGMYIDEGTFTEMNAEKDKYDRGEKKIPKKIKNPILRVVEPHESEEELSEDEPLLEALRKLSRPVRGVRVKQERMSVEPERKKHRGNSLPPSTLAPPSSTVLPLIPPTTVPPRSTKKAIAVPVLPSSAVAVPSLSTSLSQPGHVTLDTIFEKLVDIQSTLSLRSSRQDRLERKVGDITNDIVGIRHESRGLVEVTESIQKDVSTLTTVIEVVKDRLPPPPKGPQYDQYGLTEEKIADLDDSNDGILIFAGKLDALLFESTHLPHQQRNQDMLRWLLQVVMHRRRHSIGEEAKKWRTQIL
ncbi:hypothetical protein PRIPAC_85720 [Pristionchus pacificus]|uniref:Uncharacterized protein n=1 Tax=Pristionchus pacificus TaxID=54126 RepID=A0A2A6BM30_PRIPA|nr:hypothetical protein PRIPAC_85720 [Pristionchus pacificus]|eukprot:PDM66992.1 hypothetical protein PRIPAC_48409 [Pristionchus pacificus]